MTHTPAADAFMAQFDPQRPPELDALLGRLQGFPELQGLPALDGSGSGEVTAAYVTALAKIERTVKAAREQISGPAQGRRLVLTPASEIAPEPVVWAWDDNGNGRLPAGALSVAAGREGTGKSSFGIWMAGQITRGLLPGSFEGIPRNVIYAAVEDSWKYTLVPRLMAAGADMKRVFRVEVMVDEDQETTLTLPTDNAALSTAIVENDVALVVLDPLMSTIGATVDTHRERDVRTVLDPLARLADQTGCVMLGIAHFGKGAGTDPSSLITGSGAFKNVPRAVIGFARDPESDDAALVLTQTKNSLGRADLPSLKYRIIDTTIETAKGDAHVGRFVLDGESDRSVVDILGDRSDPEERSERSRAVEWLTDYLTSCGGQADPKDIKKAAAAADIAQRTLERARAKAKVTSQRNGFGKGATYVWTLDPNAEDTSSPHTRHARQDSDGGDDGAHGGAHGEQGADDDGAAVLEFPRRDDSA